MASSNRHWPSLFKSKPCGTHHQWQHDVNHGSLLSPPPCHKPSFSSAGVVGEERSPEPKPRWNPKPEQIRILEAIFNSGMVNPPRDEIRKIRAQLQEYGQVGDANVFYWFQNRKSRSKHKQRQQQHHLLRHHHPSNRPSNPAPPPAPAAAAATSSSSSSSDRSSGTSERAAPQPPLVAAPPNPAYFPELCVAEPVIYLPELAVPGGSEAGIWSEMVMGGGCNKNEVVGADDAAAKIGMQLLLHPYGHGHCVATSSVATTTTAAATGVASPATEIQGPAGGAARSVVLINEVPFEVAADPLNIREAFGEEAVLIHSSGQPVLTDEWGLTLHPLQHGASYYLV